MSPRMSWIFFASASLPLGRAREGSIKGAPPRGIDPGPHDSSSLCPMPPSPPLGSRSRFQSLFHVRRRVRRRAAISPPVRVVRRGFNNEPRRPDLVSHTPFLSAGKENRTRGRVVRGCNRLQALASWLTMDISGRRNIGALPTFTRCWSYRENVSRFRCSASIRFEGSRITGENIFVRSRSRLASPINRRREKEGIGGKLPR